jgi:hypothetical protein
LVKAYKLTSDQITSVAPGRGSCIATDRITVDGCRVGYCYRVAPRDRVDSGWRFFSGDETQDYIDQPENLGLYDVNTIANCDGGILPVLDAPIGSAYDNTGLNGSLAPCAPPAAAEPESH